MISFSLGETSSIGDIQGSVVQCINSSEQKSYRFRLVPCSVDGVRVPFRASFIPYYRIVPYCSTLMNKQFPVCIY